MRSGNKFLASSFPLLGLLALLAFFGPPARAADPLAEASQLAAKAQWGEAENLYAQAYKENGNRSAAFFYNYGTAALQNNQAGAATTLLLKSLRLNPLDGDARANLRLARGKLSPPALAVRPASALSWWPEEARAFPVSLWWTAALALLAPFLFVSVRHRNPAWRWPALAGAVIFFAAALAASWDQRFPQGGLIRVGKILSGPAPSFPEIGNLDAGAQLSLEEERDGWYKIRYITPAAQEVVGWVEAASVLSYRR